MKIVTAKHREPITEIDADRLWRQFLSARETAMQSLQIADAVAAGHAWANFLNAFVASPPATA